MSAMKGVPQFRAKPRPSTDWQDFAKCVDYDPDIWFKPDHEAEAKAICAECPVRQPCTALGRVQHAGVWGGRAHHSKKAAL